jgi:hypothetical protein
LACLTCDKFATDATFLPELTTQRARIDQLIDERRTAFTARTGCQMGEHLRDQHRRRQPRSIQTSPAASSEPSPISSPTSNGDTAKRSAHSNRHWKPPTSRTSNYAAGYQPAALSIAVFECCQLSCQFGGTGP